MKIEVWSDVVCPWCWVGKRNLELALEGFEHRDQVEVVFRSYELDPNAPPEREGTYEERLARKYGVAAGQARAMISRIVDAGALVGLDFRFDIARPGNTFDAHRLIQLGGAPVKERLMRAYFTEGEPIGDRETLVRLAVDAGLAEDEVRTVLDSDLYADAVRADERAAAEHDITGVPFFAVDGKYGVAGAQPPEILRRVLERRFAEAAPPPPAPGCDDDGVCAV
ncbi:MAG TPA: DsbA family oxidoreductase [Acidimicrobiales bacterium]|nr:DsbA family oxidoreductase [Acidimicrobiales bacterium]